MDNIKANQKQKMDGLDLSVLVMITQTFIIIYFIYNLSDIADFKKRLSDRIREEKEKKE